VLLAYTKITLADELLATELPDDPYFRDTLHLYFPTALRQKFAEAVDNHALRREIITTLIVNDTINRGGCTFAFRLREETGASYEEIARTHTAARAVFGLERIWDEVEGLDNEVAADVQTRMRLHSRRLVERATRWMLNNRRQPLDIAGTIAFFQERVDQVWSSLPKPLRGEDLAWFQHVHGELTAAGVPEALAGRVAGLSSAFPTLDITGVADRSGTEVTEVADLYYDLADRLGITHLLDRIIELPRTDRWSSMARASIREDLFAAHAQLAADVLVCGPEGATPSERYEAWAELNGTLLTRAKTTLDDIRGSDTYELSSLSVAMRVIRTLLRAGSMG
jgi:glutamate dehydrogenase